MVIQRGWKILSDAGSTSASSTEANRSPTGLNSSSDDSNCSNQTTHSMVTSLVSPAGNNHKLESIINNSSSTNNSNNNPETMKFVTTPQMAEMTLQKLRQRFSNTTPLTSSSAESGMRSLELVRIAVQSSFDKEIDELVKKYIETYFKPAFNNIKENLGQGAINEDALQKMSCALLENAKSQYKILRFKPQSSITVGSNLSVLPGAQDNNCIRMALKRPAPNKPTATVIEMQKRFFPDNVIIKTTQQQQQLTTQILPAVGTLKATLIQNQPTAFVQQPQQQKIIQPNVGGQQPRRQIFWNTAHISTSTKFVLDVQANQAFGFFPEGKERLASKHPELIRYLPDNEDREWLVSQQIIPQPNRNSRFLFLIHDEVCRLYQTHDVYKTKPSIDLSVMMTFTVPEFMIQKMKIFFVDLNIKSRGLITNSYSVAGGANAAAQSNSHLRNALLLGTQASVTASVVASPSSSSTATSTNTGNATITDPTSNITLAPTSSVNAPTSLSSSNITSTEGLSQHKNKSSNLSSSHATLTALLNNSSPATNEKASNSSNSTSSSSLLASTTPTLLNKLRK